MDLLIERFKKLFEGYEKAYTTVTNFREKTGIDKIEASLVSRKGILLDSEISMHLFENVQSIGIIPLKNNNTVKFAVIDLDIYGFKEKDDIYEIEKKVNKLELPLLVCQSKSKGVHLYLFLKEELDASYITNKMKIWAGLLGYEKAEIFPKQVKRASENDIGNAINLPYFNSENTTRFCVNNGKKLSLTEFLDLAELSRRTEKDLKEVDLEKNYLENLDENYNDAPPCIQYLLTNGINQGARNNGLFCLGVYFKKKFKDEPRVWQDKIMEMNGKLVSPPLSTSEIEAMNKGLMKKEVFYKCNDYPLCQYCNKEECKKRDYGLASCKSNSHLFNNLIKYETKNGDGDCRWCISFEEERIEISTDELMNQKLLQKRILEKTTKLYRIDSKDKWEDVIHPLIDNCSIIYEPEDTSEKGQFIILLDMFLTNTKFSKTKHALKEGRVFLDELKDLVYFRSIDFYTYLKNKKFNYKSEKNAFSWFKSEGGSGEQLSIQGKKISCWVIKKPDLYDENIKDEEERI